MSRKSIKKRKKRRKKDVFERWRTPRRVKLYYYLSKEFEKTVH